MSTDLRADLATGQGVNLPVRTTDPPTAATGYQCWIRSDLNSGDKIATLRWRNGADVPIYPTSASFGTDVYDFFQVPVGGQMGVVPMAQATDAAYPGRRLPWGGVDYAMHDALELSALPDSVVQNIKGSDYDEANNNWVANIGTDLPDAEGDPTTTTVTINGTDYTAVRYIRDDGDASQTTTEIATGDPIAIVYTIATRSPDDVLQHLIDSDSADDFAHLIDDDTGFPHRILSNSSNVDVRGDDADANFHTFAYEISSSEATLERDTNNILTDSGTTDPTLGGLTVGARGDLNSHSDVDALELSVLDAPPDQDVTDEVNRQISTYS